MLEKILNKYFAKKAIEFVKQRSAVIWCDKKIVKTKQGYELYIKKRELNDNYWKFAYDCRFEDGLERCIQWYYCDGIPEYINNLLNEF